MEGLVKGLAGFVTDFSPKVSLDVPVDLEAIAKIGRRAVYDREQREADGYFHPSKLASPCLKKDVIERILLEVFADKAADLKLESVIETYGRDKVLFTIRGDSFDYKAHRAMDVGTAFHGMEQQKYFGPSGSVIGFWSCSNCHRLENRSLMPHPTKPCTNTVVVRGINNKPIRELPCEEHGMWEYVEVDARDEELKISFRIDLVVRLSDGVAVVDIKSMDADLWERLEQPSPKDVVQLQIYMWLLEKLFGETTRYGILRYVNKGKQNKDPKHFTLEKDPKVEQWVRSYIRTVNELVVSRRWEDIGGVCDKKTQVRAKRCPFSFLCF